MKNIYINFAAFVFFLFSFIISDVKADNCDKIILNDDFSTPSNWTAVGNGSVGVSGGSCNFVNASGGGVINKISQNLTSSLSDDYWKAECKFTITGNNPSGSGTSAVLTALTAGSLDFMNNGSAETNQDGIAAVIFSDSPYDQDINNWKFIIENKKGSTRTTSTSYIYASSSISTYYIRLERISTSMVQLSVFTDAGLTTHLSGSPITFAADPAITGLNTVQHGFATPAYPPRLLASATIDNDLICQDWGEGLTEYTNKSKLLIFPNPSGDIINLDPNNTILSTAEYFIYDIIGDEVASGLLHSQQINISFLSEGVYFIKITGDKRNYWGRFQKCSQ